MMSNLPQLIDTHAHIYLKEFGEDISEVLDRFKKSGVDKVLLPNIDETTLPGLISLCEKERGCYPMLGLHPCYVKQNFKSVLEKLDQWKDKQPWIAIGEIGTDLYWDKSFWKEQQEALSIQINWAKDMGLPIVLHCRESIDETIDIIREHQDGNLSGVFHCFTGDVEQAAEIRDLGFYLGIGGVVTFKNSGLDKVVENIPLSSIVLETDSPYLAPVPFRGKRNEPSYIINVAQKMADIHNISIEELAKITTQNAENLFSL